MKTLNLRIFQLVMALHVLVYRLSRGRLLNVGDHIILLSTIGRKSGRLRTVPLYSVRDGAAYVVIGSYGGGEAHPAWYHNLQARPRALVTDRGQTIPLSAEVVAGAEYDRLWAQLCAANSAYEQYRSRTTRVLPIVRLRPQA
jgi:F420H(2)-dependent quinone reductase